MGNKSFGYVLEIAIDIRYRKKKIFRDSGVSKYANSETESTSILNQTYATSIRIILIVYFVDVISNST